MPLAHKVNESELAACLAIVVFRWKLDIETLSPEAGFCSTCPLRSSHHPGLFEAAEFGEETRGKKRNTWDRVQGQLVITSVEAGATHGMAVGDRVLASPGATRCWRRGSRW